MTPIVPIAAGLGLWYVFGRKKPSRSDFQVSQVLSAGGVPVKVATPIPKTITVSQTTGRPSVPTRPPATSKTVTQTGTTFAPGGSVIQTGPGSFQIPPIVITPSGASSVAIAAVLDVQRALNALGYKPPVTEDGKLGPKTIANIKQFQSKNNLAVDGNAGPATKAALSAALTSLASGGSGAPAGEAATRAQTSGTLATAPIMTARDVQRALNLLGASPKLAEDGKLGPRSVAAIKSFQLSHGLVADGVAGPKTKIALNTALASGPESMTMAGEGTFSCGWS